MPIQAQIVAPVSIVPSMSIHSSLTAQMTCQYIAEGFHPSMDASELLLRNTASHFKLPFNLGDRTACQLKFKLFEQQLADTKMAFQYILLETFTHPWMLLSY